MLTSLFLGIALAAGPQPAEAPAPLTPDVPEWMPHFEAKNPEDAAVARVAWEAAWECTGRHGKAHPTIDIHRRVIPGSFLGLAEWDEQGVYAISLDPRPGRLEEVIVHEVAHAWVQGGPQALVEGRAELLADCIVSKRDGLAALQWDDGRELHSLPDLKTWSNRDDHGPAVLADARTDAYLGAARLLRAASLMVDPKSLWEPEVQDWEDFRALLAASEDGPALLAALDGGPEAQRRALDDSDLDGLPRITEELAGTRPDAWDSDGDGWWDGEVLGIQRMAVAVPFDGSPVCTGLAAPEGAELRAIAGGNLRGEGRPEVKVRQTAPGAPILLELGGNPRAATGGLWGAVEGRSLTRDSHCVDASLGTIWAVDPEFGPHISDFAIALHEVATRADARWGPTTRRMGVALGGPRTTIDGQVVQLSTADVARALEHGRLEELATLAVSIHRVWDNGTRQWPVATAMARSLTDQE